MGYRAKKPLYRRVNTRTHGVRHHTGGDYRHQRNTKAEQNADVTRGSMHGKVRHGMDYTPLFRFLLSKVGEDWDAVHSEATARLDRPEPIFWMVTRPGETLRPIFRMGESSYYSKLYIDAENRLAKVTPELGVERLWPFCACCTHTFNGKRFTNAYDPGKSGATLAAMSVPDD